MAESTYHQLDEDLQRTQAELRRVRVAIKSVQRAHQREELRVASCGCTQAQLDEAIAVFCLSDYNHDQAELCLCVRVGSSLKGVRAQWHDLLCDEFMKWSPDELSCLWHPESPHHFSLRRKARIFAAEYHTVSWVHSQNEKFGLGPSGREVYQKYRRQLTSLGEECDLSPRQARKFALHLRRAWRLGFRKWDPHDDTTPAERAVMVRTSGCPIDAVDARTCAQF